ncbi:MAG: hypothetical protein Q7K43_05765 [Candidatus Woesearchaeota archaeon]|nr:hypothetical protein [Candidatus Woesearchaeota archaeon]
MIYNKAREGIYSGNNSGDGDTGVGLLEVPARNGAREEREELSDKLSGPSLPAVLFSPPNSDVYLEPEKHRVGSVE